MKLNRRSFKSKEKQGYWRCTHCGNIEYYEREVICWKCGKGEMIYIRTKYL